jgi:hypothetical protein
MFKRRTLKKYTDYLIDILLALSAMATLTAGYIVWFVLPRGTGLHGFYKCLQEGHGEGNWGMALGLPRFIWVDIHNWASVALIIIIIIHVILHLAWFKQATKNFISSFVEPAWDLIEQYTVSIALFLFFAFEIISGFTIWNVLPRGALDYNAMLSGNGRTFWGLQRDVWVDLHAWVAVIIVSIVIIHLIINWRWVVSVSKNLVHGLLKPFQRKGDNNVTDQS